MAREILRSVAGKLVAAALVSGTLVGGSTARAAAVTTTVDPAAITNAYVNVFTLTGAYQYGFVNSLAGNPATFNGTNLTLGVNSSITDGGTTPSTVNYSAATYAESTALAGSTVTFNFTVLADSLLAPYTAMGFIGDFVPNFSSSVQQTANITGPGNYSITLATTPGDVIQYGFTVAGPNSTDALATTFGTLTVGPTAVPEPATLGVAGLVAAGTLVRRGRRARRA